MKTTPRVKVYIPSLEEVHVLVQRALREGAPIDRLANAAIFPEGSPRTWGEWPSSARDAWQGIVAIYTAERPATPASPPQAPRPDGGRPSSYPEISHEQAWRAVLDSMHAHPTSRLTWPDLAQRLGVSRRAAQHHLVARMGFAFHGQRGQRTLAYAPCLGCRNPTPYAEMDGCRCAGCNA